MPSLNWAGEPFISSGKGSVRLGQQQSNISLTWSDQFLEAWSGTLISTGDWQPKNHVLPWSWTSCSPSNVISSRSMLFSLPTLSFYQAAQVFFTINLLILQTLRIFSVLGNCLDAQDAQRRVYVWCLEIFTRNLANVWTHHSISSYCLKNRFCKAHGSAWWINPKQWCWLNEHIALRYWILDAKHLYKTNGWGKTSNKERRIFL